MSNIGTRVGAILSGKDGVINFLGYGEIIESEVPPAECGGMGELLHKNDITNPTILLDNGKKVFGCECWWGPEEKMKEKYLNEAKEVIEVDIDEYRKRND